MRILVTGGAGFIASHIVDRLIAEQHEVCIVDNLSTGKQENINPSAIFYNVDIRSEELLEVFENFKPQILIHHAAQISVSHSVADPSQDASINISGTINILDCCYKTGVQKIIYASSAAVYGYPEELPVKESAKLSPLSPYGLSKLTPEFYIQLYSNLHGLKYTILRYSNAYGERQDPKGEGGVISIFLDNLLAGKEIQIHGDGAQTRDFIYVKDIVNANIAALTKGENCITNISTQTEISVKELFEMMRNILGIDASAYYMQERIGDIKYSSLSNQQAQLILGWTSQFTLYQGLKETINYYQNISVK
ncbi:NAD-dependent epimerase/dehydratase family protein [Paenibacillus polymyxa]|uniref:NAD-dependent epimerase/dehydratase family protein n=1 Tax=Paenibacillus TaxID=44249 RepID=UPI0025B66785|nr:NAD-dependent epimerase/dehydratase family protein [Paenibacillus polymyxa]MDN4079267.1 NAD-dependent epimerase/dehydratase family protein [Paenibacillus polymyxa]MDN4081931.1 NAD-dependent epimerase/dehydratase family protein [Paenibacillus polymyxa]MDN4088837.1 NAD-dependent epimerase/dehydratase family protein [Paenibacillus polymyxa]MDN4104686.1 NAD-dependent epimerase/dehydratase family protein [Paenibacillus polymyxa]MDN4109214.1 NAD-dependent epimerase/dehydratase family protein [Pae